MLEGNKPLWLDGSPATLKIFWQKQGLKQNCFLWQHTQNCRFYIFRTVIWTIDDAWGWFLRRKRDPKEEQLQLQEMHQRGQKGNKGIQARSAFAPHSLLSLLRNLPHQSHVLICPVMSYKRPPGKGRLGCTTACYETMTSKSCGSQHVGALLHTSSQ